MRKRLFLALLVLLTAFRSVALPEVAVSYSEIDPDEYNVYSALLTQSYISEGETQVVIDNYTQNVSVYYDDDIKEHFNYLRKRLPSLSQRTIDDFKSKDGSHPLHRSFNVKIKYTLISHEQFERFAGPNGTMGMSRVGWETFYREYPGASGFLLLSRVGFDPKKTQALVFVLHMRGNPSGRWWGDGSYLLLVKKNGLWRVHRRTVILYD